MSRGILLMDASGCFLDNEHRSSLVTTHCRDHTRPHRHALRSCGAKCALLPWLDFVWAPVVQAIHLQLSCGICETNIRLLAPACACNYGVPLAAHCHHALRTRLQDATVGCASYTALGRKDGGAAGGREGAYACMQGHWPWRMMAAVQLW